MSVAKNVTSGLTVQPRLAVAHVSGDLVAVLVSAIVGIEIGAAVTSDPLLAALPLAALGGILLLVHPRARILFLVFGGLLTLQSSAGFGGLKLVYLAGVMASFGGSLFQFSRSTDAFRRALTMPLLRVSVAMAALILLSFFVSQPNGVARTDWLRDVAPYLLFALAPLFALDAQRAFSRKALVRLLVSAGTIATTAFATHFVEQRHIAHLPLSQFALSSFMFPTAMFAYATATALQVRHHRPRWALMAVLGFTLLIVTGTRSTLLLILAPVVAVIAARRNRSARFVRLALVGPVALVLMLALAYGVVTITHASTTVLSKRITTLKQTGTSTDASYLDRQAQTRAARQVFYTHPIFGAGPGTYFNWRVTNGERHSAFIIDSPLDFPAKFGIAGLAVVAFLLVSYGSFLKTTFQRDHPRPETLALAAYGAVTIGISLLANPLEDKGWTLGLILLLGLVLRTSKAPAGALADSHWRDPTDV